MNYDTVALGDVCDFLDSQRVPITESDRKPGPYPYYGANGQQDSIDSYIFDEPLVLLAEDGGYFGSKDRPIAYKVTGKCWVNNHAHVLRPKSNIDVDYLHRVLSYYDVTKYINGTTRQKLTKGNAENISFPLPPLTEQKRIASLLARADRLRHLRRTAHELGESLLQSVFLGMFYYSETKWEQALVEDLVKKKNNAIRTGPFGSQLLHSEFTETGDVLVLGIDNAVQNEFSWGKPRYITHKKYEELKRYTVFPGDLIITIMATNGRVAVVPDNIPLAINTKHLCCITLEQKICLPKFLQACLLYHPAVLKQMGGSERGAVMPGLNMEIIKNLVVPVPPLSLQEEFVGVVARVESLRGRMSEGERQVEGLFESLLHEAFNA